jgi:predicted O-linked N-acetylglucosamine transferase (SPINDLY family)
VNAAEINDLLNASMQKCEQGAFEQAESICLNVLHLFPQHDLAMNQLGVIAYHQKKYDEAVKWWQQTLAINPQSVLTHLNLGTLYYEQHQYQNALTHFKSATNIEPNNFAALSNQANTLLALNQFQHAIDLYQKILNQHKDRIDLLNNQGLALLNNNQLNEAELVFVNILDKQPDYLPTLISYANLLLLLKKHEKCIEICQTIMSIKPDHADTFICLSGALLEMEQYEKGLAICNQGLALAPSSITLLLNKVSFCKAIGDKQQILLAYDDLLTIHPSHVESIENRAIFYLQSQDYALAFADLQKVIALDVKNSRVFCNSALALSRLNRYEESIAFYDQALVLEPNQPHILMDKAAVLSRASKHREAIQYYKMALTLQPNNDTLLVIIIDESQHICDWSHFHENSDTLKSIIAKPSMEGTNLSVQGAISSFFSLIFPAISPLEQLQCAQKYTNLCFGNVPKINRKHKQYRASSKIRIGYLSGDFRRHAVSQLLVEVLELHNRSDFTVIAFSYGVDDGSALRARVEKGVDHFVDLTHMNTQQATRVIADMDVDILIDLAGHTDSGRPTILAQKPAPIQISYLGYLGTTGADFIDYLIADPFLIQPDEEKNYAEKIIYLPSYQANDRQCEIGPMPTRQACGLPEDAIVFCCFNVQQKITPIMFDVWCQLLSEVAASVLWLFVTNEESKTNLIEEAQSRGINPSRLLFAGIIDLPAHLGRLQCADLFLDTFPYNAGTTASNALWVGLPVITCAGDTFASRMAGSLLTALDVPELITYNLDDYFQLALQLASDSNKRKQMREKILINKTSTLLFDTPTFTTNLEAAYKRVASEKLNE